MDRSDIESHHQDCGSNELRRNEVKEELRVKSLITITYLIVNAIYTSPATTLSFVILLGLMLLTGEATNRVVRLFLFPTELQFCWNK